MLNKRRAWLNGKFVPFERADVHLMSHSFCRGSAVFEVMSVHATEDGPAVFRLDEHLARLFRSAELTYMRLPLSERAFREAVLATARENRIPSGMVKLICYYGNVEFEVIPRNPEVSVAIMALNPLTDLSADRFKKESRKPAEITIARWRKVDPRTVPVECKCAANYLGGMIAKMEALKEGFSAPVLLDLQGHLSEGATESIFLVKNRVLKTPALGQILSGITRKSVLQVARDVGIKTAEKKLKPAELLEADEAFFTSSLVKVYPISRIGKRRLCAPGEVSRLLDKSLEKICAGKVESYKKWLTPVRGKT